VMNKGNMINGSYLIKLVNPIKLLLDIKARLV
jgi:hypothetical protein